ncbi:MAG: FAD:protein FMN transferase [Acidimicrobiia bacterium]
MGREARVIVIGGAPRVDERTRHLIEVLERKWSRFRSGSEVTRLNDTSGRAVVVSPETYGLVARALGAWRVTGGRFDPSVPASASGATAAVPSPGCARVELDEKHRSVKLPAGVHLDVSGIARGFAIDLAVNDLAQGGVSGTLVSIGADVRVAGEPPRPEGWLVDVEDPLQPGSLGLLRLRAGAVSTCAARLSGAVHDGQTADRLVDPTTGLPARTGIAAVTVVAGEAWWAQAIAKAAFVSGPEAGVVLMAQHGVTGLVVRETGEVLEAPGLDAFC